VILRGVLYALHIKQYSRTANKQTEPNLSLESTLEESRGIRCVKSVVWRLAVGYGDELVSVGDLTSRFPSAPTPVVTTEPVPVMTGPLRHVSKEMGSDKQW